MLAVLSNKLAVAEIAAGLGIPVLPSSGLLKTSADARAAADDMGLPLMFKAANNRDGLGMRLASDGSLPSNGAFATIGDEDGNAIPGADTSDPAKMAFDAAAAEATDSANGMWTVLPDAMTLFSASGPDGIFAQVCGARNSTSPPPPHAPPLSITLFDNQNPISELPSQRQCRAGPGPLRRWQRSRFYVRSSLCRQLLPRCRRGRRSDLCCGTWGGHPIIYTRRYLR